MHRPRSSFALAVSILAGFLNRRQQDAIEYLRQENRVLHEMLGGRRLRFTDAQRKRLAIRGKAMGRALLKGVATLVQPHVRTRPLESSHVPGAFADDRHVVGDLEEHADGLSAFYPLGLRRRFIGRDLPCEVHFRSFT